MNRTRNVFLLLSLVMVASALTRFLPLPENFSPIAAICLFGAAHFARSWQAMAVAIGAVLLSDVLLNNLVHAEYMNGFTIFYDGWAWQYGMYAVTVLFAARVFRNSISMKNTLLGVLGASTIFFLGSNFGVWMSGTMYPMNFAGLIECYNRRSPLL